MQKVETEFELQPRLRGELLELRPLRDEDFDSLFAIASDPLIWEQHPEPDRWKLEVFRRYFDGGIASGGALAIIGVSTGRIIGSSRYANLKNDEVEIGWTFLERAYWGGTFNGELKKLMIEHAFRFVDRVVFVVGKQNLRSQRAVENIGARFLRNVEAAHPDGAIRHNVVFVITNPDRITNDKQ